MDGRARVTLSQLRTFLAVARLGSVKAAAASLGVSEPAVSGAVASLRRELGDPLFQRGGHGVRLTAGGHRLAASAAEIVGLAEDARRGIRELGERRAQLRVAATPAAAEYVVPFLLDAFARRQPDLDTSILAVPGAALPGLLRDRRADVAVGPRPPADAVAALVSVPFLRFQLAVVTGRRHPLAAQAPVRLDQLAHQHWALGPGGLDRGTLAGALLARLGVRPEDVSAYPSTAGALHAAAEGRGVSLAYRHVVTGELAAGDLVDLAPQGCDLSGLLYASQLAADRSSPAAAALVRFLGTPVATQAALHLSGGVPMASFRPAVFVTIWS